MCRVICVLYLLITFLQCSELQSPELLRKGTGPRVMAVLRNLIIDLCSFSGKASLAAATRHYMCYPEKSVELVSTPIRK